MRPRMRDASLAKRRLPAPKTFASYRLQQPKGAHWRSMRWRRTRGSLAVVLLREQGPPPSCAYLFDGVTTLMTEGRSLSDPRVD
jgi:hypothetical protein